MSSTRRVCLGRLRSYVLLRHLSHQPECLRPRGSGSRVSRTLSWPNRPTCRALWWPSSDLRLGCASHANRNRGGYGQLGRKIHAFFSLFVPFSVYSGVARDRCHRIYDAAIKVTAASIAIVGTTARTAIAATARMMRWIVVRG